MATSLLRRSFRSVKSIKETRLQWTFTTLKPGFIYDSVNYSQKATENEDLGPLKFTTSSASSWRARQTRSGGSNDEDPWYQPLVISLSISVFLLYFCVLREENDIDQELGKTLYDRIEGLEEKQLELSLAYNKEHGLETKDLEDRLAEIDQEKIDGY